MLKKREKKQKINNSSPRKWKNESKGWKQKRGERKHRDGKEKFGIGLETTEKPAATETEIFEGRAGAERGRGTQTDRRTDGEGVIKKNQDVSSVIPTGLG